MIQIVRLGIVLFSIIFLFSCHNKKNDKLQIDNERLKKKINELLSENKIQKNELEKIYNSPSFLFQTALELEKIKNDSALLVYRKIIKINTTNYWSVLSKERISFHLKQYKTNFFCQNFLAPADTLILEYIDDKCGEWGGDEEIIKIYFDMDLKKNVADYIKNEYECDELERYQINADYKTTKIEKYPLSLKEIEIVKNSLKTILNKKLSNYNVCIASRYISVELKNDDNKKSIYFRCYIDKFIWTEFEKLKYNIINNN